MQAILPYMGKRRSAKINEILAACEARTGPLRGERQVMSKLTAGSVIEMRNLFSNGDRQVDLAKRFNVSQAQVSLVVRGKKWAHVEMSGA
jgi:hypothetical protein